MGPQLLLERERVVEPPLEREGARDPCRLVRIDERGIDGSALYRGARGGIIGPGTARAADAVHDLLDAAAGAGLGGGKISRVLVARLVNVRATRGERGR